MARPIILHIGASKTGSSAIQKFMAKNRSVFVANGYAIPDRLLDWSDAVTGEHVFALQELISSPDASQITKKFKELDENLNDPNAKILLSAENLSNMGQHVHFQEALRGFSPSVLLYIRRQDDLLTSAWQQWHSKIENNFDDWIIKGIMQYGHWDRVISAWETVVGDGNVKVRVFNSADFVDGDLLRDFLSSIDFQGDLGQFDFNIGNVNPSFSDIVTPLVSGNRDIFENAHDSTFLKKLIDMTGSAYTEGKKVSLLRRRQRESILHYYSNINQRVCAKYFPGRPRLFPVVDHDKYRYLSSDEMRSEQLRFLTHLIYKIAQKVE